MAQEINKDIESSLTDGPKKIWPLFMDSVQLSWCCRATNYQGNPDTHSTDRHQKMKKNFVDPFHG